MTPGAMRRTAIAASLAFGLPASVPAQGVPLSSIDWLSDSLAEETALRPLRRAPNMADGGAGGGAGVADVTVAPLDAPLPDSVGVLGPEITGLPGSLWGPATTDGIALSLAAWPTDALPAARAALENILLAKVDPPRGGGTPGALVVARIDTLLRMGALDAASALLEQAGTGRPELFRRAFDIALLQGREDVGCETLRASPGIAPSLQVRIFCLARSGDWSAAALTLETADALGQLSPVEDALLARFLDPELADGVAPLARLPAPTPLEWRMLEAIGERQPTSGLPRAFAHADLRPTAGWKTRIEATEKLTRAGALPAHVLRDVYDERDAAASGGVWDRVDAIQALTRAIEGGEAAQVGRALGIAWEQMEAAGLALPFATMFAECLAAVPLEGRDALLAHRIALLSPDYETAALNAPVGADPLASALARGLPPEANVLARQGTLARSLGAAFSQPPPAPPAGIMQLAARERLGEALVAALGIVARGADADPGDLGGALAFLRSAGLEDTARRAALQIYLLGLRA